MSHELIDWAVAGGPLEEESGDLEVVRPFEGGVLVAAIDGLGHGPDAAHAAKGAAEALERHAGQPVTRLLQHCHEELRGTRGAVITVASLSARGTMSWAGIGNIEGTLVRAGDAQGRPRESVMLVGGVVGHQLPRVRPNELPLAAGDTLVLTTDGIRSGYLHLLEDYDEPRHVVSRIIGEYGKGTDDALVLVARYRGARP